MPRPPRPLDPTAGPVQSFAAELRLLRDQAGNPKYLQMARASGRSRTALAEAAGGDHLPTWETVAAFVTACKGDLLIWRSKWEQVRDRIRGHDNDLIAPVWDTEGTKLPVSPSDSSRSGRHFLSYLITAAVSALVTLGVTLLISKAHPNTEV